MKNNIDNNFFTLNSYVKILQNKKTICIKDYSNHKMGGVLVRHDVDFSIDMAYEFSRHEKDNNINATYYILLTSDLYNPFSKDSKLKINQMISDGFEIGIHFDSTVYGDLDEEELIAKMSIEVDMFEKCFNYKILSYSMHNPSTSGIYIEYPNLISAYNIEIFSDENYISDSSYSFRGKDPFIFIQKSDYQLIQFLTHPIHFFNNDKNTYEKQLNTMMNKFYSSLDNTLSPNKTYSTGKHDYYIEIKKDKDYDEE